MECDLDQQLRENSQLSVRNLSNLLTNHSFDENPLATFQSELSKALPQIVAACTTTLSDNGIQSISFVCLEECLKQLDWKSILEQRDARLKQHNQSTTNHFFSTPCDLLLSCWKDPTLWPPVCNGCLMKVVLEQLLFHRSGNRTRRSMRCGRFDWSPSYSLLLEFFIALVQQQPSLHQTTGMIAWIRTNLRLDKTDPETINVAVSIVKELIRSFPSKAIIFVPLFLDLLCAIEAMVNRKRSALPRAPKNETGQSEVKRSGQVHGTNLDVLHGESSDREEETYQNRLFMQLASMHKNSQSMRVDRKQVFNANTLSTILDMAQDQIVFLCALRLKCLKAFLSSSKECSTTLGRGAVDQSLFHAILELVESRPGSETISVRLAALLLVNTSSQSNLVYQKLLKMLWSRVENMNDPCAYLSFYVELLIESSFFDDRTVLADAIQPLCDRVTRLVLHRENQEQSLASQVTLHCIASLLAYRGSLLLQIPGFKFLLAQLSVEFPSPKQWLLLSTMSSAMQSKLLTSLRMSGMFGIEEDEEENEIQWTSGESWYYDPHHGSAIRACNYVSSLASPDLFSRWSPTNSYPKTSAGTKVDQSLHSHAKGSIALHDLGDDVLREVFSFLGFKRIVFNRQVCKRWKCIGDDEFNTWMPMYLARFGVDPEDPILSATSTLPWKQLFMQRWVAEKEIRFKRDKNGWRWRLCRRIGCLTVHPSPSRLLKHQSTHQTKPKKRKKI